MRTPPHPRVVITQSQEALLAAVRASARDDDIDFLERCLRLEMAGWPSGEDTSVVLRAMAAAVQAEFGPPDAVLVNREVFNSAISRLGVTPDLLEHLVWGSITETSGVLRIPQPTLYTYALVLAGRYIAILPQLDLHTSALYALATRHRENKNHL
jgi:hypothetical protein